MTTRPQKIFFGEIEAARNLVFSVVNRFVEEAGDCSNIGPTFPKYRSTRLGGSGLSRKDCMRPAANELLSWIIHIDENGGFRRSKENPRGDQAFYHRIMETGLDPLLETLQPQQAKRFFHVKASEIGEQWSRIEQEITDIEVRKRSLLYSHFTNDHINNVKLYCFYRALLNTMTLEAITALDRYSRTHKGAGLEANDIAQPDEELPAIGLTAGRGKLRVLEGILDLNLGSGS